MGLKFLVKEENRLPQISAIMVPEGINEAEVRAKLLSEFNLEIGAGLGPLAGKIWRFGLMGYTAQSANVMLCLSALGSVRRRWDIRSRSARRKQRLTSLMPISMPVPPRRLAPAPDLPSYPLERPSLPVGRFFFLLA